MDAATVSRLPKGAKINASPAGCLHPDAPGLPIFRQGHTACIATACFLFGVHLHPQNSNLQVGSYTPKLWLVNSMFYGGSLRVGCQKYSPPLLGPASDRCGQFTTWITTRGQHFDKQCGLMFVLFACSYLVLFVFNGAVQNG